MSLLDETAFARTTPYVVEEVSKRSVDNGEMTKIRFQQHVHRPIFGSHSQRGDAYTLFSDGELLKVYKHQPPGRPPTELVALQDFTSCFECDEESLRMVSLQSLVSEVHRHEE